MANESILSAFERMWQHIANKFATKDDLNAIDVALVSVNGQTGEVNLSADDVGAAPGGYGWGESSARTLPSGSTVYLAITETGLYKVDSSITGLPHAPNGEYFFNLVFAMIHPNNSYLIAFAKNGSLNITHIAISYYNLQNSNYGEWHWLNPPMLTNEEYCIMETYNNSNVYIKRVSLPDPDVQQGSFKQISPDLFKVISYEVSATKTVSNEEITKMLPCFSSAGAIELSADVQGTYLYVNTHQEDVSGYSCVGTVKYTKNNT